MLSVFATLREDVSDCTWVLIACRLRMAQETAVEAAKMLEMKLSPRAVVNRCYYSVFYALLALFLHDEIDVKSAKHTQVIGTFDAEYVRLGKLDKKYSQTLHRLFRLRLFGDYKDYAQISRETAARAIAEAHEFVTMIGDLVDRAD